MSVLEILHFPDSRLRKETFPVDQFNGETADLVENMLETMYQAPGVGLAAPQLNISKRIIVIDVSENRDQPLCLINPEITVASGQVRFEEGCLSVPGIYDYVDRAEKVAVKALDKQGKAFEMEAEGLLAVCIQHEIDHLKGTLFVDYLSEMKRKRIVKKLEKLRRQTL